MLIQHITKKKLKRDALIFDFFVFIRVSYALLTIGYLYLPKIITQHTINVLPENKRLTESITTTLFVFLVWLALRMSTRNNYSTVNDLPPDFQLFLKNKLIAGVNKTFAVETPTAVPTATAILPRVKQILSQQNQKPKETFVDYSDGCNLPKKRVEKPILKNEESSGEEPIERIETQNNDVVWNIQGKHGAKQIEYNHGGPSKVVELWSLKDGHVNHTHHAWWKPKKIQNLIKDGDTYDHFASIGQVGHFTSAVGHPGYIRTGNESLKIKSKHQLFGDCRLYFRKSGETIVDGQTKILYEPYKFKRKSHIR